MKRRSRLTAAEYWRWMASFGPEGPVNPRCKCGRYRWPWNKTCQPCQGRK